MSLKNIFDSKEFIVTVELSPPRGTQSAPILEIARNIKGRVDGVNVTDNQKAMMRMSALAFSHLLKEQGVEPIMQVCCRDKNRLALQSELLGAYGLGISNICAMTGDHPSMGDHPASMPVFDLDSVQLIEMIKGLAKGKSLAGKSIDDFPDFYVGGVVNPFSDPFDLHVIKIKKKIASGADFFQTQPFFDRSSVEGFLKKVDSIDRLFLIGIVPLKSVEMVDFMNAHILSEPIPEAVISRLKSASNPSEEGMRIASELINSIKGLVRGIHIMPIGAEACLPSMLEMIGQ